ncbi:hypothetical protein PIB30_055027 [Stylosanthes scabra]|uniref:Uncharacterized protein n=1 Tax=Stylosanthes scabra TaxID=79078 RepID=A0ABU6SIW3_9FABA|nr:hypothetical protein [Stylosanthes scabra]
MLTWEMMSRRKAKVGGNEERTTMKSNEKKHPQKNERKKKENNGNYFPLSLLQPSNRTDPLASEQPLSEASGISSRTYRPYGATTFGASLATREARNVGNASLPEFRATVPDIGPRRPKSSNDEHIAPLIQ